ncbi:Phosphotransferase enzyme family protein [Actinokineospora alba]|uniref:Phosphotransferase enzyme family protein n=1 Tax=Actinokineospora alba TaxID=504798 RepID=A0A1H0M183_9PSEU|nr:phosphotransferase [Actinokineospora alba]TDP67547.1 phosphotransferase family enzyme [Actinokineospora alba]SDI45958.1 Phosphotransferase enzyme family protein [Actinokineospora alba]SDO74177.1 Phosphotransferase enzyme family protein [Actinokineospora alba]
MLGLGRPRRVDPLSSSPGSQVWAVDLADRRVVVKQLLGHNADTRFHRELVALRAAAEVGLAPEVLDADAGAKVTVLEYVESTRVFPDPLTYARTLARLHAITPPPSLPTAEPPGEADLIAFLRLCTEVGLTASPAAEHALRSLLARVATGGPSLLHGDPCPGNLLVTPDGVHFIDFEQAGRGSGLAELAYLRMAFPTCGYSTVLAPEVIASAESAYLETWRDLTGTDVPGTLTDHCIAWLLRGDALVQRIQRGARDQFARVLVEDWSWGPMTARERLLHRLRMVIDLDVPAAAPLFAALAIRLETRWS